MRGTAGITHGQMERCRTTGQAGKGPSENSLKIITGHKLSMNQEPDGESEGKKSCLASGRENWKSR